MGRPLFFQPLTVRAAGRAVKRDDPVPCVRHRRGLSSSASIVTGSVAAREAPQMRKDAQRRTPMHPEYTYVHALASNQPRSGEAIGVFPRAEALAVVVADGGGGMRSGGAASRCLVSVVGAAVSDAAFALEETSSWVELFRATDAALNVNSAGETAGLVVVLGPRGILGISVGDSEAWVVRPTGVDELTVGRQAKQRLGTNRVVPTIFERAALNGVLVVGSDGLFKFAGIDVIARVVRHNPFATAPSRLIELVRLRSGQMAEDAAVVLVRDVAG
jgi:serine/threonine protein phosphatase PrpC